VLKYSKDPQNREIPAIEEIKRVSTEGQRIYVGKNEIKKVKNGFGISIISTSQGVMAGEESRRRGLGGELICEVW
jgi:small subunit ribosomal protein S8